MTSIVVLTYNQLEDCTKSCIKSIYEYTDKEQFELIIVDNDSQDGTKEYLKSIESKYPNIKVLLNDINKGYAGGNNDGIKASNGEYVILLNNDTLVSEGWLERLLRPFHDDCKVGLVGPISNSVGNEQRVNLDGLTEKNYNEISKRYTTLNHNVVCETQRLGFFCVAIKRNVIDTIGLLDEQFGIGMFEDDDYCLRSIQAGFKNVFVEGCFIYHKGSVSFKKLATEKYQALFQKNKAYFLSKHHVDWSLSDIAFSYWHKFEDDLKSFCITKQDHILQRVLVRMVNFEHLLLQMKTVEDHNSIHIPVNTSPYIKKARWKIRLYNFKREFLYGTFYDKKEYVKRIIKRVFKFLMPNSDVNVMYELEKIKAFKSYKKVVLFPATIDYTYMKQRPQHIADALAQNGYLVFYSTLNHQTDKVSTLSEMHPSLFLINEKFLPILSHVFEKHEVVYYCLWANNIKHLPYLKYTTLLYDFMDELDLLEIEKDIIKQNHEDLLKFSDLITVSAEKLADQLPLSYRHKILTISNGIDIEFLDALKDSYNTPKEIVNIKNEGYQKIIGYYGAIAEWMDFSLVNALIERYPSYAFVFIGPVFNVSQEIYALQNKYKNFFLFSQKPRLELIPYLKMFDICILPFIKNSITNSVSPVKIYEYLAAKKPVISVDIVECKKIQVIDVASSNDAFIAKLSAPTIFNEHEIEAFLEENVWSKKITNICKFIEEHSISSLGLNTINT
ncbi:glycosyltransferase [Sulfurospirillum sp.]|uniref:glycosyltransferase n=1 Tax=Sulfurospirillum sp. TaxID=2053622 RepID=UPI002FDEC2F3